MAAYTDSATALVGRLVGEKYQLRRVLGEGGMGAVYEALNTWTSKRVALKLMLGTDAKHEDFVRRFQREAKAIGRIEHENIVQVLDLGIEDGNFFLVQEFLDGHDLRAELDARNVLSPKETCDLLVPVMAGVAAAHAQGVIHRDIKPQNLFLMKNSSGRVIPKVIDFGIAKLMDQDDGNVSLTRTGAAIGTPLYMSPEQARGDRSLDAQTDIWSLGIVMFECLTGECPFDGNNHNEVIAKILTMTAPPLHSIGDFSQSLSGVVAKALERSREKRYRTMDEFREAVLSCPEFARNTVVTINHSAQEMSILPGHFEATTMSAKDETTTGEELAAQSNGTAASIRDKQTQVAGSAKNHAASMAQTAVAQDSLRVVTPRDERDPSVSNTMAPVTKPAPPKVPAAAIIAAGALLLVVIVAAKVSSNPTTTTTPIQTPAAIADSGVAPTQSVQIMGEFGMALSTDPPHSNIELDGRSVGVGAYAGRFIRDGVTHRLRVSATGYIAQELTFTDAPPPGRISLVRAPGGANARTLPRADAGSNGGAAHTTPRQTGGGSGPLIRGYE